MSRDDFEEEDAKERASFMKRRAGTFDLGLFERLAPAPGRDLTARTMAVLRGDEPYATSAWCSLWIAHARHPVWVARALELLLSRSNSRSHAMAAAIAVAFDRMMGFRKSTVKPWWLLVSQ